MSGRLRWLVGETVMVGGVNLLSLMIVWNCYFMGFRPRPVAAGYAASCVFVVLTIMNVTNARLHAPIGRLLSWPLLLAFELITLGATWSVWTMRVGD